MTITTAELPRFDFRRPSTFAREHVRNLEVAHEVFVRRFGSGLGNALRATMQTELLSVEQMTYDDYIRSMPNPTVLATFTLDPLPGAAILELNVQQALVLVDRMLGGQGTPVSLRRPTEVEGYLLHELLQHALVAFRETFEPLLEVTPTIGGLDYNPQLVQVAAPSEVVLLFSYRLTVTQGARSEGLITLCYPVSTLAPAMERLVKDLLEPPADASDDVTEPPLTAELEDVDVHLSVRLRDCGVPAQDLATMAVGDVLRLDHRVNEPVHAQIAGTDLLHGHLGRNGRRLAFRVDGWQTPAVQAFPTPPDEGLTT